MITTQTIPHDEARDWVFTFLTSDEEREQAIREFYKTFGLEDEYDAKAVREWVGLDDEEPEVAPERPQIDDDWRIYVGQNERFLQLPWRARRYYVHLAYLEPSAFSDPLVAQHVTTLRGFRTADEAIAAAYEVAADDDRHFEENYGSQS